MAHVQPVGDRQPDVAVDPAAAIPAGVGLSRVVHPDGHHVDAGHQVPGDVVGEAGVAVGAAPQMDAVDPDVGVHVHAIELEPDGALACAPRQPERLAVPPDTRGEEAHAAPARGVLAGRAFDAPVVRKVQPAPVAVVEPGLLGSGGIAQGEAPAGIHGEALPLRRDGGGSHGERRRYQEESGDRTDHGRRSGSGMPIRSARRWGLATER